MESAEPRQAPEIEPDNATQQADGRSARVWVLAAAACALAGPALPARAQPADGETSGYVTLATDARSHGVSQLLDGIALRLGIDYQHRSGFFAGGVLGNVSYPTRRLWDEPRDRLVEMYTGYQWQGARWALTTTLGHYAYPDTSVDYDYTELSAVVDFRGKYFYSFTYTEDLSALGAAAIDHEIGFTHPLPADIELSASVGAFDVGGRTEYSHFNVGATRLIGRFGLDLRYYGTSREIDSYFGSTATDRWVFSLSYAIRNRK